MGPPQALMVKSSDDGRLVGIMSERDFVKVLATGTADSSSVKVIDSPNQLSIHARSCKPDMARAGRI